MTGPAPNTPIGAPGNAPIQWKVIASTVTTLVAAGAVAVLNAAAANSTLLGALPAWAQFLIVTLVPPLATAVAGYQARPGPYPRPKIGPPPPHDHPWRDE